MTKRRHVRHGDRLDDDETIVIRGGLLDADTLRADAERYHDIYAGALRAAGFRLDPTGRNPRHFTVVFDQLDLGVDALVSCEHSIWTNPYHES